MQVDAGDYGNKPIDTRVLLSPTYENTDHFGTPMNKKQSKTVLLGKQWMINGSDRPSTPLIERVQWKTIDELIRNETNTVVLKRLEEVQLRTTVLVSYQFINAAPH